MLLVEQNVHHALDSADRAYVMETGRITLEGPADELAARSARRAVLPGPLSVGDYFLQQGTNALSAGSLYAMMAVGLALIFSILRLINFAHGDVMMIAVYLFVFAGFAGMPVVPAALVVMIGGTILIGLAMERVAYRPLRGGPEVALLLTSFAVGQILQNSALLASRLGRQARPDRVPGPGAAVRGASRIGPLLGAPS